MHDDTRASTTATANGSVATSTPTVSKNVWSLLKRSIVGAFHKVSVKHLDAYLEELELRFNNRNNPFTFRDVLLRVLDGEALRYEALTA